MTHRLLIAVDGSPFSEQAVSYAASAGRRISDLGFTLLQVRSPSPGNDDLGEGGGTAEAPDDGTRGGEGVAAWRGRMVAAGIDPGRVDVVEVPQRKGVAEDILSYARAGRYDAILVGRRGRGRLRSVFMGSVTAGILGRSNTVPVWVVDGRVDFGSVLVAVDGSEGALRAVEHLSDILAGADDSVAVTLFHVVQRFGASCPIDVEPSASRLAAVGQRGSQHCIDRFWERAQETLAAAGVAGGRLRLDTADRRMRPGRAILDKVLGEGHDTVVIGRRGASRSVFTGSVSRYLTDHVADRALWVVS